MASTLDKPQAPAPAPPQETTRPPVEPLLVQCASCGAPIAFDQTYCLECGAKSDRPDGWLSRFKTRRYVLGGLAVLLAIGGIVGYAVAAASRHDAVKVPSVTDVELFLLVDERYRNGRDASGKWIGGGWQSGLLTAGGEGMSQPKPAYAKLFSSGRSPVSAGPFDPNHMGGVNANSLSKVFDHDASTVWKSGTYASGVGNGVGFYVDDGAPGSIKGLGLLTKTPGFDTAVYGFDGDTPPPALSGWTYLGTQQNVTQRQKISLDMKGQQYQLYLVWFTKLPAKGQRFEIPEAQLLP